MASKDDGRATARPWWYAQHDEWGRYAIGQGDVAIFRSVFQADSGPGEAPITEARDEHARANAALVVRAVNAHDGLVAALEAAETCLYRLNGSDDLPGYAAGVAAEIRAALAVARGEQ